ncbi:MAG: PadR family transcriptional regulator [Desulfurococcales archaeon]|nr:PadR family transcriptional regulator [Desulfurococcales archaeon]
MDKKLKKLLRDARVGLTALAILKLLVDNGSMHGYGIRKMLSILMDWDPPETSVYDALKRLEKLGLARSYWARGKRGVPRKYYEPTQIAEKILNEALDELGGLFGWLICRRRGESD